MPDVAAPSARDWRGTPIEVGDMVVFPYAWGGMPLAMCEGEIVEIEDDLLRVDLHFDTGQYMRKNDWAKPKCNVVTKVGPRELT